MEPGGGALSLIGAALYLFLPLLAACTGGGDGTATGGGSVPAPIDSIGPLPGSEPPAPELRQRLAVALAGQGPGYTPRTRHLREDGSPRYTNRLILEPSPYLQQHAHNPVNWYPWGDEAFEAARAAGRPVLLSVGYSTCHWCHVMEEESFEDEEIARYMNEHYVAIKVDREERPDIDAVYMAAVQALSGRGGWPMTVWLTPDREPFFGGTYFPPRDGVRGARKGFLSLLGDLQAYYHANPDRIAEMAGQLTEAVQRNLEAEEAGDLPGAAAIETAVRLYKGRHDQVNGGLQGAPKFPSSLPVGLLMRYHRRTGDVESLRVVELTLERMAAGGMYDQVGGGFHRYSTDQAWLVPHFEKMLYDNALLVPAYLEGFQLTGRADFARVARETLEYLLREMTSPEGGFYSATDADSEGEEGKFFVWSEEEIRAALPPGQAAAVVAYYGVTPGGNFEGNNILHTPRPLPEVAAGLGLEPAALRARLEDARRRLYEVRSSRVPPLRDDKILTAWNGLAISAFARAALVLDEPRYAAAADAAARFVLDRLRRDGRLLRSYRNGEARLDAYLDDYAFLIAGLLDLHEATHRLEWLESAIELQAVLDARYRDPENGAYFQTSDDHESLLVREKPDSDGAVPSGNSVAVLNLLRLHELTTDDAYRQSAVRALRAFGTTLSRSPVKLAEMLAALDFLLDRPKEIVIVTPRSAADAAPFLARLRGRFLPNRILAVVTEGEELERHARRVPLLKDKIAEKGRATAYVCENRVCALPTTDPEVFARQIAGVAPLEK